MLAVAGGARKAGGNPVAVAGQVARGPTGDGVARGDFTAQARYVLDEMRESSRASAARWTTSSA